MNTNDQLMDRVAQVVDALRRSGLEPTLIGGLAVYLGRHLSTSPMDVRSPAYLASIPRPTRDVDFAIVYAQGAEQVAATALKDLGLAPATSNPWTFSGDNLKVDLIPCLQTWNQGTDFQVEKRHRARPLSLDRVSAVSITDEVSVGVCDRAMLVLQKALAWSERYAKRDLADIATLAIANGVEGGSVTADLQQLVDSLPSDHYSKPLKTVASRFADEDQPGPSAFFNAVEDSLRQRLHSVSDDDETAIRKIASIAVRQLLKPWC